MPRSARPKPGLVYIAGLLHNIGFLVLGHLFPREHQSLNRLVADTPEATVLELEAQALRITHPETGAILLRHWQIMPEVTAAVLHHHDPQYQGDHSAYANLLLVADRLLRRVELGDGDSGEVPAAVLERLALAEFQATDALERTLRLREPLDELVASLSGAR
jgi:HD-like signal output (HDOD) protein